MLLAASVVLGVAGWVINVAAGNPSKLRKHTVLELGGLVIVLWIVAAVLLAFGISRFNRARRAETGELQRAASRQATAVHLARAGKLVADLLASRVPEAGRVWDVVLRPGERLLLDGSAVYARYYGLGARHGPGAGAHPRPAASATAASRRAGAGRHGRAEPAAVAAGARWREQRQCRVVVSDQRVMCQSDGSGWLSFEHREVSGIEASPDSSGVVFEIQDAAPLRLSGPLSAEVIVVVVWALFGADGLREHPALMAVRQTLAPEVQLAVAAAPAAALADLLGFVAGQELVLAEHVAELLGINVDESLERLEALRAEGLLARVRFSPREPAAYRITAPGAGRAGGDVPPSRRLDVAGYGRAVMAAASAAAGEGGLSSAAP